MNINKKSNGGWILCRSKSIPGKYYYFNVVTGEAVWSLNETESKFVKRGNNIERVTDKVHNYPEPVSPPGENVNTPSICYPRNNFRLPSFGNAIFPNYISNVEPYLSNIIWTPIQMPMFMTNTSEVKKQTLDQNTQTFELDKGAFVQTCAMSLSERFALFENMDTDLTFNANTNNVPAKKFKSSTPIKNWWSNAGKFNLNTSVNKKTNEISSELQYKRKLEKPKLILRESKLKRLKTLSESNYNYQMDGPLSKTETNFKNIENTSLCQENKVVNAKANIENSDSLQKLDQTDLRFLIQSKKRKSVDLGVLYNEKQKQANNILKSTPKKKVSFNLTNISDDYSSIQDDENDNDKELEKMPIPIITLRKLDQRDINKVWYISVDEDVLLDDFDFIKDYIYGDNLCRLLIPVSMIKYIESLGIGEHAGRSRVIVARQLYRRLATSEQVQTVETDDGTSLMDDVIKCCIEIMDKDLHVVLITKNVKLEKIAKSYGIHVYSLNDIKNGITIPVKRKVSVENNNNDNLFLQKADDFDPFILSKSTIPVNSIKMTVFNYNKDDDINKINHLNKEHITNNDKRFYNSENKLDSIQNSDNNSLDVCFDIEKLNINDKKLTDIKRVIKNSVIDNTNATSKIIIHNSDKIKPFKSIFDHITIQNGHKNDSVISKFSKAISSKNDILFNKGQQKDTLKFKFENITRKPNYLSSLNPKQNVNEKLTTNIEKPDIWHPRSANKETTLKKYNCSITSINNSVEERLKSFDVKDKIMGNNIIKRYEEWVCCYVQIMEEFIHIVLQKSSNTNNQIPYFLRDGLVYIKEIYFNTKDIKMIVEKLLALCGFCPMKGTIKKDMDPNEFMKILGCGFLLVEVFKNILPEDLSEIEGLLTKLLESIENSKLFEDPQPVETPLRRSEEDICMFRRNFIKRRSDIVDYLKKHFVEWKNYVDFENEAVENEEINQHIKIFRTSGKNLNTFKIDNKKRISFENPTEDYIETNKNRQMINIHKNQTNKQTEIDIPVLHENTFDDGNNKGPKVIRNIKLIDEFEEKVKEAARLDLDDLDYSEIADTLSSIIEITKNFNETQVNDSGTLNDCPNINIDLTQINDTVLINDGAHYNDVKNDSTVDSGFENEVQACTLIKNFLTELSVSFKLIYTFIDKCIKDFRDDMTDETRKNLLDKANQIHTHIADVTEKLKVIIERESSDSTLKSLLIKAGSDISEDKRMTRYRQTVTKCLEQAQILESSLKIMLNITNDCDISVSSKNEIRHFNIFE